MSSANWGDYNAWKVISVLDFGEGARVEVTRAMEISGVGCFLRVSTEFKNSIAEALSFVPFAVIVEEFDVDSTLIGRRIDMQQVPEMPALMQESV